MLERFVDWFWSRFREHYFNAGATVAVLFIGVFVLIPTGELFAQVWRVSAAGGVVFGFTTFLISIVAAFYGANSIPRFRRPIEAWIAGDHSNPLHVRDSALVSAQRAAAQGLKVALPLGATIVAPMLVHFGHLGWRGFLIVEVMIAMSFAISMFLVGIACTLLARPLLEEIATELTVNQPPKMRAWSVKLRLFAGVSSAALVSGLGAGGIAYLFDSSLETGFVASFVTSVAMAVYCSALFQIGLAQPTLKPLEDLEAAITRVRQGDYSHRLAVTSADQIGDIAVAFNDMMDGLVQRQALHAAFGSYVDPALAQRLLNQDSSIFDGEAVDATMFFADVRGFTTYADNVTPENAVAQLNRLFDILVPAIRDAGGHPNRYTGDGVLAVFGTPEPHADHADRAVRAAIDIQCGIRDTFGDGLRLGIGINTGQVIAGTIGGGGKLDFTVIGDAVNIASRVEEMTKDTGDSILLTQAVVDACSHHPPNLTDRGDRPVRGKTSLVRIYALA
ncbi:MAG: adenylate cyclase [Actinomycetota bacterium]